MIPVYYIPTSGNPSLNTSQNSGNLNSNEVAAGSDNQGPHNQPFLGGNTFVPQGKLSGSRLLLETYK